MKPYFLPVFLFLSTLCTPVLGIEFRTDKAYELPEGEALDHELWINADDIQVYGSVSNDFFFFGDKVKLEGDFNEDVWGMARHSVTFSGKSKRDMRIYAQKSVKFAGSIDDNLMIFADTVQVDTNATIHGDAMIKGRIIVLTGNHIGDLNLSAAESVSINGKIEGDLVVESKSISIEPGTQITGDLRYHAPRELTLKNGVQVDGTVIKTKKPESAFANNLRSTLLIIQVAFFLTSFLFGIFLLRLFPKAIERSTTIIRTERTPAMFIGSALLIGLGIFSILAFMSVVGIPLALLILSALTLLQTAGKVAVGYTLGQLILKQRHGNVFALFVGLLFIYLATMLPLVGGFVWFMVSFLGVGTIMTMLLKRDKTESAEVQIPTPPPLT